MSDTESDEQGIRVSEDGISVTKSLERERFPVPAVGFELRSERDTPATIRLRDRIPASVPANDIGFHPEYGAESWAIEDDTAVFEREIAPGDEHLTFYAIREVDIDEVESSLSTPEIVTTPSETPDDETATEDETVTNDETVPDDETISDDELAADDGTVPDDTTADDTAADDATTDDGSVTDERATAPVDGQSGDGAPLSLSGSVAAALATELRRGSIAAADSKALREEFGTGDTERIAEQLSDATDQIAALESALGEDGTIHRQLETISSGVESLREDVAELDERSAENTENIDALEENVTRLGEDVEAVHEEIDWLDDEITDGKQARTERLDALDDRLDGLEDDIRELSSWRARMATVFGGETAAGDDTSDDADEQ